MRAVFALRWRIGLVLLGGAGLFAPAAQASSFVTIAPPKEKLSSSFVVLGQEPPKPVEAVAAGPKPRSALDAPPDFAWEPAPMQISASIVAFGAPAVEQTKVASIAPPKAEAKPEAAQPAPRARPRASRLPKVIRAGVKGHAFPDYVAPQLAAAQPAQPPAEPPVPSPDAPPQDQPGPASAPPPAGPRNPDPPALQ